MTTILNGKELSRTLRSEITQQVSEFIQKTGITPCLAAILVGDDPASQVYVRNKEKACAEVGMKSQLFRLPADTTQEQLLELVDELNHDDSVHGILCQLPLPKQINEKVILDAVSADKDVDAFHPANVGLILQGRPRFLPCTPFGIQEMLKRYGIETAGKHVVILGRSDIVGKPMAAMMVQRGIGADSTVTVCHSRTANLPSITSQADILIVAIGKPKFVTSEMVKDGAVVVDVGINRTEEGLVGDVDFEAVQAKTSAITPVPGGVGPLTITMLLGNTLKAAQGK
ncbi:MAG: bifunctional methylenetetrahydrofolate dehydrogenase/methenyltetrahydrofolate cyclohydrolase FolD [Planctomycetaceae bacterium]|nr:bifunctional methylenetetrahydrofolate dehydrogenase/methenyltetrahydrofolate cyclohydrolase FolD [Planctomycetaceae bacterium]